jgi:hypothetical protein
MKRMKIPNVTDGSTNPPRLALYGNAWGLSELPRRPASETWSFEEVLDKIREHGFEGMQGGPDTAPAVRKHGLRFAMAGRLNDPLKLDDMAHRAGDEGADSLTLHCGWGMESDHEMDIFAQAILEASLTYRLPIFAETHRATFIQDVYRTCRLIERFPDLRFNADLSHYYYGMEMTYRGFETSRESLGPILERIGFFHGRVSDAESMQIDIGDGFSNPHARNFMALWELAMTNWLKQAQPGDILPFAPELGPPSSGYSITTVDSEGATVELSDRWAQSLVMRDLAIACFDRAKVR